jgi:hypothetical protein
VSIVRSLWTEASILRYRSSREVVSSKLPESFDRSSAVFPLCLAVRCLGGVPLLPIIMTAMTFIVCIGEKIKIKRMDVFRGIKKASSSGAMVVLRDIPIITS